MMSASVAAQPYRVSLYRSWADHDGLHVGFQVEDDARAFAASRPEPLIDLSRREDRADGRPTGGGNVIAVRRPYRDDFPQVER